MTIDTLRTERLPARTKILYGVGDAGFSMTSTIIGAYLAIFLTDVVGLDPGLAALAVGVGRTWDWINDPLMGYISDRTRSRWGRRRPFLLFGFIPFGLFFALLWWVPPWRSPMGLAVYYSVAYLLYEAAATLVYMPYFALTPELTLDYDERTSLTSYRMFVSIVTGLVAFVVPMMIIGSFRPENMSRVLLMGAFFGVASALPLVLTFLGTRERPEFLAQKPPALVPSLRAALRNRPFLFGIGVFLLTIMTMDLLNGMLLYFLKYYLGIEKESEYVLGAVFIVAAVALPLWGWLSKKWSKRRAYIIGIAFWAVVQLVMVVVPQTTPLSVVLVLAALAGIGVSAAHVMPWAMIPDAIELDEWQTGERHEGMFYSLITLIKKVGTSIAIPLSLLMLKITGYEPNAATQNPRAVMGIRVFAGPVPAALLCGGILLAALYPLTRQKHSALREELQKRKVA